MEVLGKVISRRGWLVLNDPPGQPSHPVVPGVLGMNVIQECYAELCGQHGPALFDFPPVAHASPPWQQALQYCHKIQVQPLQASKGVAKVRGKRPVHIPGGTVKVVAATCSMQFGVDSSTVLLEPASDSLPEGLLVSPALVQVRRGTVLIPVVNVGRTRATLPPRHSVGRLAHVSIEGLPTGITEVVAGPNILTATLQAHSAQTYSVKEQIQSLDLSVLTVPKQEQVRSLLLKHEMVFSAFEGDLGCTNLSHDIPLLDDRPVRGTDTFLPPITKQ